MLGALKVRDVKTGIEFEIGTGFTEADRVKLWQSRDMLGVFKLAKYKYFAGGSKDKPRFPVF
jgi:DNA ligase-1